MKEREYDIYLIPHSDQHGSEYLSDSDERIKFISGFSGSNGIGLVTQSKAIMFTDGRYFIQIEKELYQGWEFRKMNDENDIIDYILDNFQDEAKIGMDFHLFSSEKAFDIMNQLKEFEFIDDKNNIIDDIWGTLKPQYANNPLMILPVEFTGLTVKDKFNLLDSKLKKEIKSRPKCVRYNKFRLLINRLDDIAWLLNLRGSDIKYNPVFFSYAVFYSFPDELSLDLFIDENKFNHSNKEELEKYFKENNISVLPYEDIYEELYNTEEDIFTLLDVESTNCRILNQLINSKSINIDLISTILIEDIKSVKNVVEIEGYKNANIKDCVALIKFFSWLEEELVTKNRTDLNEYEIGLQNKKFREEQENYMGESYAPICACGENSAIIHYEQNENLHSIMTKDKIILCDTGGHYKDGTTDITRTVHYGTPTSQQKEIFTRVLLGNLFLEKMQFKRGKTFEDIDPVARQFLFMKGLDFLHDTSHGVGHFLNVHEGPYGKPLQEGNIITNEPGYYEKDNFGVRIENELLVIKKEEGYLGFENLTFLPYERNLIDMDLISGEFKKYIDDYHKKVFEILSPFLDKTKDEKVLDYLKRKTQPL